MSILTEGDDTQYKILFARIVTSDILVPVHFYQFERSRFSFSL